MQEVLDVAQESTAVSSKVMTAVIGTSILALGILDLFLIAPDDTSMPFPVSMVDEAILLGTGSLLIYQSGAIDEMQKIIS